MKDIIDINVEYQFSTFIKLVTQNGNKTTKIWFFPESPHFTVSIGY